MKAGDTIAGGKFWAMVRRVNSDDDTVDVELQDGSRQKWTADGIKVLGIRVVSGDVTTSDRPSSSPYVRDWNGGKIDIYRICQLWGANHPAQLHALKKILCAGQRGGGKDVDRDIREAIVALERWLEMRKEDAK